MKRCAWRWRLGISGQPLLEALRRCYNSSRTASSSGPPGVRWGRRTAHTEGRRDRGLWGPGDSTSPSPSPNAGPCSPARRRPTAAGSGENWGTRPSHSLPQPHPRPEGGSKVLAAATAAPCPAAPSPRTATANGLGVSGTCCAEPAAPAGRGRYPESLCWPRRRRTPRASLGRGRRKKTDSLGDVTSCLGAGPGGWSRGQRKVGGSEARV